MLEEWFSKDEKQCTATAFMDNVEYYKDGADRDVLPKVLAVASVPLHVMTPEKIAQRLKEICAPNIARAEAFLQKRTSSSVSARNDTSWQGATQS